MPTERQPCGCEPGRCELADANRDARYCKIEAYDALKAKADALDRIYSIATRELAEPPADGTELLVEFCTIIEEAQAQEAAGAAPASGEYTFDYLGIGVRSYNCLHSSWGNAPNIADDAPVTRVMDVSRPHLIKNFGIVSFVDVLKALLTDAKISIEQLRKCSFYQTAPAKWRSKWDETSASFSRPHPPE